MHAFHPRMRLPLFLLLIVLLQRHYKTGQPIQGRRGVVRIAGALLFVALLGFGA